MTTYRELISMVLDQVKGNSDDFHLGEAHIAFLLDKHRSMILAAKYKNADPGKGNKTTLCVDLAAEPGKCNGGEVSMKSTAKLPVLLGDYSIHTDGGVDIVVTEEDRLPYATKGEFAGRKLFAAREDSGFLKIVSRDARLRHLRKVKVICCPSSIPDKSLLCTDEMQGNGSQCDEYDIPFPIEEELVVQLLGQVKQDVMSSMYNPVDNKNDGKDGLADIYTLASAMARQLRGRTRRTSNSDGESGD